MYWKDDERVTKPAEKFSRGMLEEEGMREEIRNKVNFFNKNLSKNISVLACCFNIYIFLLQLHCSRGGDFNQKFVC